MAQKSSRKNARNAQKKPHMRTGGGTTAKRERRERRSPHDAASHGPLSPVRPAGSGGMVAASIAGWVIVGAFLAVSLYFGRWMTYNYPDSLWWMLALGGLVAAPAIGWVAQTAADAVTWALEVVVVAAAVLAIQVWTGPTCAVESACGVVGAQGSFGRFWSVGAIVIVGVLTWYLALFFFGWADRRRANDNGSVGSMTKGMIWPFILVGMPLMAVAIPIDAALRSAPGHAKQAVAQVGQYCFDDATTPPELTLRPSPEPAASYYNTFLVRRANETRRSLQSTSDKGPWLKRVAASPYEAMIAFNSEGERVMLACRRIDPAGGRATKDDFAPPTYAETENPFKPQDVLQQPSATPPATKAKAKAKAKPKAEASDKK